ncbi:MAG: hypothetical protein J0649_07490, partial [Methylococcales bacterium]|nr:hypothetical protein [Methylococcales bacterium]
TDKVVASGVTNLARPDISDLLQSSTQCGFLLKWDALALVESTKGLADSEFCPIEVKVDGDERPIIAAGSPTISEIKQFVDSQIKKKKSWL